MLTSKRRNPNIKKRIIGPPMSGSSKNSTSHFLRLKIERVLILILYKSNPNSIKSVVIFVF